MLEQYEPIMTVSEVSEVLMVSKNTTYELLKEHKIQGYRNGRIWYITKDSLLDYIRFSSGLPNPEN
jgi:excisionase family DNA binding protein